VNVVIKPTLSSPRPGQTRDKPGDIISNQSDAPHASEISLVFIPGQEKQRKLTNFSSLTRREEEIWRDMAHWTLYLYRFGL
jgi:hypothetical protein